MEQLFLYVLNNAITVSALIIAIIVVRAFGKKMPKWIACMLWMIVAIKLVVPVHIESVLSLIPTREPIPSNITMEENPQIASGISSVDGTVNSIILQKIPSDSAASVNPLQIWFYIGGLVWAIGMAVLIVYAVVTYILLRKRVRASVKVAPKVYECDDISDSFILGIIMPRIYLPSGLSKEAKEYILKHEFAHISRLDYIWKPLGFVILSVYWFNPLCWIAYILLCKDIEYACDEKATMNIEKDKKAEYCKILLENSIPRNMIAACPVAFGGTDVKNRIKNVVNYKKPAFWITMASVMVCAVVGVCFATSRSAKTTSEQPAVEQVQFGQQVQNGEIQKDVLTRLGEGDETAANPLMELKEATDPEVIELFNKYYEAQANGDTETLKGMLNCDLFGEYNELRTMAMAEHIERYDSIKIYTQPGPHEGTYIAYGFSNIKYKEYDKPIPDDPVYFYLCHDEKGKLYINNVDSIEMTSEERKYFNEADLQPSVLEKFKEFHYEYNRMLEEDKDLEGILNNINDEVAEQIKIEVNR